MCATRGSTSLAALRVRPAHPSPVGHPLTRQLPNSCTAKHPARQGVPTLRVRSAGSPKPSHPPAIPTAPATTASRAIDANRTPCLHTHPGGREYDAIVVAAGTKPTRDIKLIVMLQGAFRHCKPIAAWADGTPGALRRRADKAAGQRTADA